MDFAFRDLRLSQQQVQDLLCPFVLNLRTTNKNKKSDYGISAAWTIINKWFNLLDGPFCRYPGSRPVMPLWAGVQRFSKWGLRNSSEQLDRIKSQMPTLSGWIQVRLLLLKEKIKSDANMLLTSKPEGTPSIISNKQIWFFCKRDCQGPGDLSAPG